MRKVALLLFAALFVAGTSYGGVNITWGTSSNTSDPRIYDSDGSTLLVPSANQNTVDGGCLVQLIRAGGGTIHAPLLGGGNDGTQGGDSVLQSSWIGYGTPTFLPGYAGFVTASSTFAEGTGAGQLVQNDWLYIRVWNNVSPGSGNIPTVGVGTGGGTLGYADSAAWQLTVDPGDGAGETPPSPQTFWIGSNMQIQLVPEPGTMALFGLGLVTVFVRRRLRG